MSVTPHPDDDDRTVMIPARTVAATSAEPTASRPTRKRLLAFSAVAGIMLIAMIAGGARSEEHTSELQSRPHLVCRLLLEKKKKKIRSIDDVKKRKKEYKNI